MTSSFEIQFNCNFESPLLQTLAKESASRCTGKNGDFDTITSIIMSYTALEAFINEIYQLVELYIIDPDLKSKILPADESIIKNLFILLKVSVDNRASVLYKYDLIYEFLTGNVIDKGSGNRQELEFLPKIRNELVHMKLKKSEIYIDSDTKPKKFDGFWLGQVKEKHTLPKFMKALQSKGVLSNVTDEYRWTLQICTSKVANWVCNTVDQAAVNLANAFPNESELKKHLFAESLPCSFNLKE